VHWPSYASKSRIRNEEKPMHDDLINLGDALERAVALQLATERNTSSASGHVTTEHIDVIEEDFMLSNDTERDGGDEIQSRRARRRTRRIVVIGTIAVIGIGGAAAAAVSTMSSDEVSHGLPGGSMIFQGTNPSCRSIDGVVFDCTLTSPPTQERLDDYTGAAELFVDKNLNIAGGCRGQSADGLKWTCYLGQRAVDEAILAADLLGQYSPSPGRG
jgi:hypothetical protein